MLSQLTSLVPGQRQTQRIGQSRELVDNGILNFNGCVSIGQAEQQRVPGRAFHERADRGLSCGSDDQVTFPVARGRPVFHTGGPGTDHHHRVLEPRPHHTRVYGQAPASAPLAHQGSDLFAQCAFGLDEEGLVDRPLRTGSCSDLCGKRMRKYTQNCSGLHLSSSLPQMMPHKRGSAHVRALGHVRRLPAHM